MSTAQARIKCVSRFWSAAFCQSISVYIGFCEISRCISIPQARTKCVSGSWPTAGLLNFFCSQCFLCNVEVHFDCAGSQNVWSPALVWGILPVNSRIVLCPSAFRVVLVLGSVPSLSQPHHLQHYSQHHHFLTP